VRRLGEIDVVSHPIERGRKVRAPGLSFVSCDPRSGTVTA
jgi:hypothetical protein